MHLKKLNYKRKLLKEHDNSVYVCMSESHYLKRVVKDLFSHPLTTPFYVYDRVLLENLVTQDHKDCLDFKGNLDHQDLQDHLVHLEKSLLPLRH